MFKLEREMIPVIRCGLSELYNTNHIVEEFFSGNGKADLVFTSEIYFDKLTDFDFEQTYYLTTILNANRVKFKFDDLTLKHNLKGEKLRPLIDYLVSNKYMDETKGYFKMRRKFNPPVRNLISIEAKLKNWKEGYYQALRYKYFSNKSFLAISESYLDNVNIELLKANRIGLISVSLNGIRIIYNPPNEAPIDTTAFYFLATTFASAFAS